MPSYSKLFTGFFRRLDFYEFAQQERRVARAIAYQKPPTSMLTGWQTFYRQGERAIEKAERSYVYRPPVEREMKSAVLMKLKYKQYPYTPAAAGKK
ncbi:unnamed protein product [Vitrella brassicaformis CCMP3155]|uniref:Uncharacterized protein n=1 Tax=Vitrella brassicaformis (strain CCMP3155) TaxID=1169540 RepID=A0A0G4EAG4_VITBC|nr:unnamed protein product [Vitrella brassicaformis CCMP3155]|eukprot:CEL92243.1 unnamed protein product [Vitrella brassicaformis CCMP3155]